MNLTRFLTVFRKSFLEQLRSPWEVVLVLSIGPAFVLLYWLFFSGGSTSYQLLVLDQDRGPHGAAFTSQVAELAYPGGQPLLHVTAIDSRTSAEQRLRDREASALVILPPDFSARLDTMKQDLQSGKQVSTADGAPVILSGDLTNPTYSIASVLTLSVLEDYLREAAGQPRPVTIVEEPLGGSATRSEFETYIPGLLVVAVVMMLFTAAMRVTGELESGGLKRLALTQVTPLEFLSGVSLVQLLVGLATILLTFGVAVMLGFHSQGPLWVAVLVGLLSAFSVIGVGLIVASFARSTTEAFIAGNFPMFLLMFFSGGVFPLPRNPLFDLIPQTHAVVALNKVLTLGVGLGGVWREMVALVGLSVLYFAIGIWVFGRRVMRK